MTAERRAEFAGDVESPLTPVQTRPAERARQVSAARAVREHVDARAPQILDADVGYEPGVVVELDRAGLPSPDATCITPSSSRATSGRAR
jgi:hypothetical protein